MYSAVCFFFQLSCFQCSEVDFNAVWSFNGVVFSAICFFGEAIFSVLYGFSVK